MSNTARNKTGSGRLASMLLPLFLSTGLALHQASVLATPSDEVQAMNKDQALTEKQLSIIPIAAFTATGDLVKLNKALVQGLDAGLAVNDIKEILVQLYAYAGFPRSLNALGEFMKVVNDRKQRGIQDEVGSEPGAIPVGEELLAQGTANQTKLSGAPVTGALFDFAPAIGVYLKTHLFGDIFARDNLDWQSRELATVGALAALSGVDSQLQSHLRISMNVGISKEQLGQVADVLSEQVDADAAQRTRAALDRHLGVSQG